MSLFKRAKARDSLSEQCTLLAQELEFYGKTNPLTHTVDSTQMPSMEHMLRLKVMVGSLDCARLFLDLGADVNDITHPITLIDLAKAYKNESMESLLKGFGTGLHHDL